jgi:predicted dehydrogenase
VAFQEKSLPINNNQYFPAKETSTIKIGIIGLGRMGSYHASVCTLLSDTELVAIAEPEKNNWKSIAPHILKTSDYKELFAYVDGFIIAVPTDLHYTITKECLLAGKHVLLEKPLTKTRSEAEELFRIAREKKRALHVGHVERFNGAVQELKKIIHKPYLIESQRIGPFSPRVKNDSVILDLMIHDLDIILGLVDSTVASAKTTGQSIFSPNCDIAIVQLKFKNGVLANLISSRTSQIKQRTMSIHQEDAFIQLDFTTQDISLHRHTSSHVNIGHNHLKYRQESTVERLFVYKDNPLKQEIEHFIQAIRSGTNLIDPDQDLDALDLTLSIEKKLG